MPDPVISSKNQGLGCGLTSICLAIVSFSKLQPHLLLSLLTFGNLPYSLFYLKLSPQSLFSLLLYLPAWLTPIFPKCGTVQGSNTWTQAVQYGFELYVSY